MSTAPPLPPPERLTVAGIGADGWPGLADATRDVLLGADVVFGGDRQLDLLPDEVTARRVPWPSPLLRALPLLLVKTPGARKVVLASGDPTFFGIATTIARVAPGFDLTVLPHPSSVSLACARLGWAQQDTEVISLVGRPPATLTPSFSPGRRLLVLVPDETTPAVVAASLREHGFGPSELTALSNLGADDESRVSASAGEWPAEGYPEHAPRGSRALTVLAVLCRPGPAPIRLSRVPGLPDEAYENDGQLTKHHVRAVTLSVLAPEPGELLWDVGGGAGSIGIEWLRTHPACRAVSIERDPERALRIGRNAEMLGVPHLDVRVGSAPAELAGLPTPDAIFVGGGLTSPGLIDLCWEALAPGGRMVANVTTLESEMMLAQALDEYGGTLTRIEITRAAPIGRFTGWRPAMPVTQWAAWKGTV
ncbi:precorrin-6y C5,15-methyltransferase (decarboxylating) subunit CbiE [Kineosporia sp. J2-2]|uniref:Precorrin-6y C5,15-methyltransferase (Decarboxylating) subunit CbiE n=1 Tax=Kineosporia corallincola TaxID=2835133 RepID=A0ABS5TM82_9ACTN|nr:precorrin-6y C5,15-methyltransferase (decarboxylating) subunit CbiE [Kineosporia corallincola]MBT0772217.1 precorrin-6y C5,15-methyltransferase (decarboxylating) subunit CbiE [Kineosporia corallincola]